MIDKSKGIWDDGRNRHYYDNGWIAVVDDTDPKILAAIDELPIVQSITPPLNAEQVEAARVASIRAKLDDLDRKAVRPLRAIAAGTATDADRTTLAEIETQAAELRESIGVTA